ncbi:MAG: CHAT domain-containing protein [bacterium]|nr:CHAT domain-containing protein [bacterium]
MPLPNTADNCSQAALPSIRGRGRGWTSYESNPKATRNHLLTTSSILVLAVLLAFLTQKAAAQDETIAVQQLAGVTVEEIGRTSVLKTAGIQSGDVIVSWARRPQAGGNRDAASGRINSVFDWEWMKLEQSPRGAISLYIEREGESRRIDVERGEWNIRVRPCLPGDLQELYIDGKQAIAEGRIGDGLASWKAIGEQSRGSNDSSLGCWVHIASAQVLSDVDRWDEAQREFQAAQEECDTPRAQVTMWDLLGEIYTQRNDLEGAERAFHLAMRIRAETWGDGLGSVANRCSLARLDRLRGDFERSEKTLEEALALVQVMALESLELAEVHHHLGVAARYRGDLDRAKAHSLQALTIQDKLAPWSRPRALSYINLANTARRRGDLEAAEEAASRAQAIVDWIAPQSLEKASVLHVQGMNARARGELTKAEGLLLRTVQLREWLAPGSLQLASSLNNLALLAGDLEQMDKAKELHTAALSIRSKVAPGSLYVAYSYNNLGLLARLQGQLDVAADYYLRALEIKERIIPDTLSTAFTLNNLGMVANARGELGLAKQYFKRALEIKERQAPGALTVANSLANLGNLAIRRGDLKTAEECFRRVLIIRQRLAPESIAVASSLENLGNLARDRGELQTAHDYYTRALDIRNKHIPGGIATDTALRGLGEIAFINNDLDVAQGYFERALDVEARLAPEATRTAETLFSLAKVSRAADKLDAAVGYSRQALEVLERQIDHLGGSHDVRAEFRALHEQDYRRHIDLLISTGNQEEAFNALERSRARSLLEMLAERDLDFTADVPQELDRTRRRLAVLYERKQHQITVIDPLTDPEALQNLRQELEQLRRQREEIAELIRRSSPRLAALQYPRPLDLATVLANLDKRTAMLSYSVGEEGTYLFLIEPIRRLTVVKLEISSEDLGHEIEVFRSLIRETRSASLRMPSVVAAGRRLYDVLIKPVDEALRDVDRIVILPDGPLHKLPFSALVRKNKGETNITERDWQYVAEWKALHFVQSATLYAELRRDPRLLGKDEPVSQTVTLAAFGDPRCTTRSNPTDEDSTLTRQAGFAPLPASRREVERIRALYPNDSTVYLGEAATEEAVLSVGKGPRILHFATHSRLDDRVPLNSALVLTPGDGDGLLQAWEIIERIRLAADLVVLSACQSGLGREVGGEGLIGLTRAFQYAGARSVVASLWEAADTKTEELMVRFYYYLQAGVTKDLALRSAQSDLIHGALCQSGGNQKPASRDASAPFYWAGFQLYGDWR